MRAARYLLLFFGGFLIVAGVLAQAYLPGHLKKTPVDIDTTTHLAGTATSVLFDGERDVDVANRTVALTDKSDSDTVAWFTYSCVVLAAPGVPDCVTADDPKWKLVNASTDSFASSRVSGLAVSDRAELPKGVDAAAGLVNKFPFDSGKQTYPYWDDPTGQAVPARYTGTRFVRGLKTYVYEVTVPPTQVELTPGTMGTYSNSTKVYVEPVTGAIVNEVTAQQRTMTDGTPALDIRASFTKAQVASSVSDARTAKTQLTWALHTGPIVAYVLGALFLVGGLALTRRSARRSTTSAAHKMSLPVHGAPA